jgi:hypothetical protein
MDQKWSMLAQTQPNRKSGKSPTTKSLPCMPDGRAVLFRLPFQFAGETAPKPFLTSEARIWHVECI